ncbi:MAG: tRNA (adenosine(37)-N6)-threonylcarbamoyltransferase complex transferase subunit TsaD [Planctomycetota bacterium]
MLVLGIETSCDETAAAVVEDGAKILSNEVSSQIPLHEKFGGVVPEIACRAHSELLVPVIDSALKEAGVALEDLSGIAVTAGPGLIGALLVGVSTAKAVAWTLEVPIVAVDHLDAHIYANNLSHEVEYPFVTLVASGGHTALYLSQSPLSHRLLGSTTDDAAGEAFDKVASILGLGYPGGPFIDRAAKNGRSDAVEFPRTMLDGESLDFSFSGIKTAVLYHVRGQDAAGRPEGPPDEAETADIAASFQAAVVDVLVEKLFLAAAAENVKRVAVSGGVAANSLLREKIAARAAESGRGVYIPPTALCTDNAAVVAGLAWHRLDRGEGSPMSFDAYARRGQ